MIVVGIIITLMLILSGFAIKKSKIVALLQNVWLFLVLGFNNGGMDYTDNEYIYLSSANKIRFSINGGLSNLVGYWANSHKLEYWQYNAIVVFVCLLLLFYAVCKNTEQISVFYSMFLIYPFIDSVIQKRFFIAFIFCVIALLYKKNEKNLWSFIFVIIALGFHFSAIVMIPYLFMDIILNKHIKVLWIILVAELYILIFQNQFFLVIMGDSASKVSTYMTDNISVLAAIMYVFLQVSLIILTLVIQNKNFMLSSFYRNAKNDYSMKINLFSMVFLPLLFMDSTFFRYYRIIMVVSYIDIAKVVRGRFLKNNYRFYIMLLYILVVILFQIVAIKVDRFGWEKVLETLFLHNQILGESV